MGDLTNHFGELLKQYLRSVQLKIPSVKRLPPHKGYRAASFIPTLEARRYFTDFVYYKYQSGSRSKRYGTHNTAKNSANAIRNRISILFLWMDFKLSTAYEEKNLQRR